MKQLETVLWIFVLLALAECQRTSKEEKEAAKVIEKINARQLVEVNKVTIAGWNYATNLTDANAKLEKIAQETYAKFTKENAEILRKYNSKAFSNETLKRLIGKLTQIGDAILPPEDFAELKSATSRMKTRYAKSKVPNFSNGLPISLEPEITQILQTSRHPDEMKYYWTQWHDTAGTPSKDDFFKYIAMRNKAAKLNSNAT